MGRTTRGKRRNVRRTLFSKLGLDPGYRKVFAIGFNKTATTSINRVLRECRIFSVHNVDWRDTSRPLYHWQYEGFTDGPPDDFTLLDRRFPRSLFILNTRDLTEWLDSRLVHAETERRRGTDPRMSFWRTPQLAVKEWVKERQHHHAAVLRHFRERPGDLLVVNYIREPDASQRIADFVGSGAPVSRPHAHSIATDRRHGELRYRSLIEDGLTELGVPRSEWLNDLLCPSLGGVADLPADSSEITLRMAAE